MLHRNHQRAAECLCRALSLAACLVLVCAATRATAAQTQGGENTSVTTLNEGALTFEVKTKGAVELTDDDADVKAISDGGYVSVKEKKGATTLRQLELFPAQGGGLRRQYTVRGQQREFDAEARAWLSSVLSKVVRESTLGGDARVRRILRQKGVEGALEEVGSMKSDYVKRVYQQKILEIQNYDASASARVLERAGKDLESEYERAELLLDVLRHDRLDAGARAAFFKAVDALGSDYERRRVLTRVVEQHAPEHASPDMEMVGAAFRSAAKMSSEYELAEFLIDFVKHRPLDDTVRPAFMEALGKIQSDYERARAESALSKGERRP